MVATQTRPKTEVRVPPRTQTESAYKEAELGFRNYWYPVFSSREINENPKHITVCGDDIVFMRRNDKVHAIPEYCPHRGTSLALYPQKSYPFKGSNTITCPYHGWTFDVTDGRCVANVCEGPNSKLPPLAMFKPYPVQEVNGIVWIWMGEMEPVALDEDWPSFLFAQGRTVKFMNRVKNGNWRWHAENGPDGHAPMVHMNSPRMWLRPSGPQNRFGPGEEQMLMHGEIKWLLAYVLIWCAAVTTAVQSSWKAWKSFFLAVAGVPVIIFGWLWQVGRFG